jgi:DNA-binding transcriptional ArsR family regulator
LGRNRNGEAILAQLESGPKTATELVKATGLTARQVQYALQQLRDTELVTLIGSPGPGFRAGLRMKWDGDGV